MTRPGPTIDRDRIAEVLVTAAYQGDKAAAQRFEITTRTVENYRARLATDPALSDLFARKRKLVEADWSAELPSAIRASVAFLARAAATADPADPDAIHSVAGALKILSETAAAKRILDARLSPQAGSDGEASGSVGAEEAADPTPIQ